MPYTAFDGISVKLNRAEKHAKQLKRCIERFLNQAPTRQLVDYDSITAKEFRDFHEQRAIPAEFSVLTGEVLYQLRSSLDHLVCALILHEGGTLTEQSQFPIFRFEPIKKDEIKRFQGQIKGIQRPEVLTLLKRYQPYQRGHPDGHWLAILKALSNTDKHRSLNLHVAVVEPRVNIVMRDADSDMEYVSDGPDDGADIPDAFTQPDGDIINVVDVQRRLTTRVAFAQFGNIYQNVEVINGLTTLVNKTHEVISTLGLFLN